MSNERTRSEKRDDGQAEADGGVLLVLEAAGLVAPILRNADERTLRRPVKVYDRETGEVVREATVREVVGGLAKATALGLEVIEGVRAQDGICEACGKVLAARKDGRPPRTCPGELGGCQRQTVCAGGCGRKPTRAAFTAKQAVSRNGRAWSCLNCHLENIRIEPRLCADCHVPITSHARTTRCRTCAISRRRPPHVGCSDCGGIVSKAMNLAARRGQQRVRCSDCCSKRKAAACAKCGKSLSAKAITPSGYAKRKGAPPVCRECLRKPLGQCADCAKPLGRHVMSPSAVAARNGGPPRCQSCNGRAGAARMRGSVGPKERSANAKAMWAKRRAAGEVRKVCRCPDCDSVISRSAVRLAATENRVARCVGCASKAMDRSAARLRAMTPGQRSKAAQRSWATRRAKKVSITQPEAS